MQENEIPVPGMENRPTSADLPPLASQAAATESAAPATEPPKKRRKRGPNKAKAATAPVETPVDPNAEKGALAQALAMGFTFGGKIAAASRGDHWLFSDDDARLLGAVWADALHPYMATVAPYMPFVTGVIVTAGVMMPKVQEDKRLTASRTLPIAPAAQPAPRAEVARTLAVVETPPVPNDAPPGAFGDNTGIAPPPPENGTVAARQPRRRNAT